MTNCTTPCCSAPARWRVAGTDRSVCADHIPDSTPVEPLPPPGILAARCPPGWRRDPLTGRPVMPCLGKLLFPCAPEEVPTFSDFRAQCRVCDFDPVVEWLVLAVLTNAIDAKKHHNQCMHLYDEGAVSLAVDAALRSKGTIRIVKTAAGWEEAEADAAAT